MAKSKTRSVYVCQNCGAQRTRWEGRCGDCGAWNTLVEEVVSKEVPTSPRQRGWSAGSSSDGGPTVVTLDQSLTDIKIARAQTGYKELDRVLGGGLVQGSFILLGGDPGIGKSTLVMQMAGGLAKQGGVAGQQTGGVAGQQTGGVAGQQTGMEVLYVSGEESVNQSGMRAQRLGVKSSKVRMAAESNLDTIKELVQKYKPQVLIVDSIQTVFMPSIESAPGSVSQVRECAAQLMGLAKSTELTIFLIGHVTKEGNIAGPKVLEHMVDTVLSFEGDMSHQFRLLRALKNRFGATHELGVFQMDTKGLIEVENPSELFLEQRGTRLIGSAVFASMEGSRPLLCEIQALSTGTPMAMPRRTSLGFDVNRVHLLVAVLNKHAGLKLANADVFINVVGGLKLMEPAADLAVAAALISTETGIEVDAKTCFFGEVGLTGEVRAVSFAEARVREAEKLGFENFVIPISNRKHLTDMSETMKKNTLWVREIRDVLKLFEGGKTPSYGKPRSAQHDQ